MNLYKIVTKNKKENHHIRLQVRHKSPIVCNGLNLKRVIHVWQGHYQGANLSIKLLLFHIWLPGSHPCAKNSNKCTLH